MTIWGHVLLEVTCKNQPKRACLLLAWIREPRTLNPHRCATLLAAYAKGSGARITHSQGCFVCLLCWTSEQRTEFILLHNSWHIVFLDSRKGFFFISLLTFILFSHSWFHLPLPPLAMLLMCLVSIFSKGPLLLCIHASSQSWLLVSRAFSPSSHLMTPWCQLSHPSLRAPLSPHSHFIPLISCWLNVATITISNSPPRLRAVALQQGQPWQKWPGPSREDSDSPESATREFPSSADKNNNNNNNNNNNSSRTLMICQTYS